MTTGYKEILKLPSRELFLECLNERTYPFSIRARVVSAYRKMISKGISPPVRFSPLTFPTNMEWEDVLVEEPLKTAKEKKLEKAKARTDRTLSWSKSQGGPFNQNPGSRKNAKVRNSHKRVLRWTSRGKDRKASKPKDHFVVVRHTIHLRGNRYSGGQDEF